MITEFLDADHKTVMEWLQKNETSNKYITFVLISNMGQKIFTLSYGKNLSSTIEVMCDVSYLGTHIKENQNVV